MFFFKPIQPFLDDRNPVSGYLSGEREPEESDALERSSTDSVEIDDATLLNKPHDGHDEEAIQHGRLPRTTRHLIIGGGQLGKALEHELTATRYPVRLLMRQDLPLENAGRLSEIVTTQEFDIVWLTAAATAVDWCETNEDECYRLNTEAPRIIAEICAEAKLKLVHFSTDYVFSGKQNGEIRKEPYLETDEPSPVSVYGASKAKSESSVLKAYDKTTVVRTSGLYSVDGRCFFNAIYKKGITGEEVRVVEDQITSPTNASLLAEWLSRHFHQLPDGIVHLASKGGVSWMRAAEVAFELCGLSRDKIIGITSEELGRPAKRPPFSVLGSKVLHELALRNLPNWLEGLARWATDKTKQNKQ